MPTVGNNLIRKWSVATILTQVKVITINLLMVNMEMSKFSSDNE